MSQPDGPTEEQLPAGWAWFQILDKKIDELGKRMEHLVAEQNLKLGQIDRNGKETNGRVLKLEEGQRTAAILADGHSEWESELQAEQRLVVEAEERQAVLAEARREKRRDRLQTFAYLCIGLLGGGLGHAIGIY